MRIDRRGFFRVISGAFPLLASHAGASDDRLLSPEIHHRTRNTRFGAVGDRRPSGPAPPPFKRYPTRVRLQLPATRLAGGPLGAAIHAASQTLAGFDPEPLPTATFSALLQLANGVTGEFRFAQPEAGSILLRAAPSAGALYAGEIYVAVERVEGIDPGLYYYAVRRHRLVRLRDESVASKVANALEMPDRVHNAAAVVLLSNVFGRYTRQYANRGYRYALIDSGHIGENLRLAAASAGLGVISQSRYLDDHLNELTGLDGTAEAICALHAIGTPRATGGPTQQSGQHFVEQGLDRVPAKYIPDRYHAATKLVPSTKMNPPAGAHATPIQKTRTLALPKPPFPDFSVEDAIYARRSAATFSAQPIEFAQLSGVLYAAQGVSTSGAEPDVELFVAAHRVRGLAPGVYRYRQIEHRLGVWRPGALGPEMVRACLRQSMAGSAAIGLVMAARLGSPTRRFGDRSYRDRLVESGAVAQRIYLAAEALGLAARNLAAFLDARFNALFDFERDGLFTLHLTMVGNENPKTSRTTGSQ